MTDRSKSKRAKSRGSLPRIPWIWLLVSALVIVAIVIVVLQTQTRQGFVLQAGERELLVLLRNDASGVYQVEYQGRGQIELQSIKPMIAGQILHVDVRQVSVSKDSNEAVLEQPAGTLPAGQEITLQPGDDFIIRVTLRGQSVGGNYMYGFRIGYQDGASEEIFELTMDFDYEIIVE
ncbi:MAG TPA: hypothetical protein VFZ76_00795 [Anaerolineales bacterium]